MTTNMPKLPFCSYRNLILSIIYIFSISSLVNPVITYKSENPAVADVASDGTITFGSEYGTTKITANYAGDDTPSSFA